jgi:hypothetical protein
MLYFSGLLFYHFFSLKPFTWIVLCIHVGGFPIFLDFIFDATQNQQLFSFNLFSRIFQSCSYFSICATFVWQQVLQIAGQ